MMKRSIKLNSMRSNCPVEIEISSNIVDLQVEERVKRI